MTCPSPKRDIEFRYDISKSDNYTSIPNPAQTWTFIYMIVRSAYFGVLFVVLLLRVVTYVANEIAILPIHSASNPDTTYRLQSNVIHQSPMLIVQDDLAALAWRSTRCNMVLYEVLSSGKYPSTFYFSVGSSATLIRKSPYSNMSCTEFHYDISIEVRYDTVKSQIILILIVRNRRTISNTNM